MHYAYIIPIWTNGAASHSFYYFNFTSFNFFYFLLLLSADMANKCADNASAIGATARGLYQSIAAKLNQFSISLRRSFFPESERVPKSTGTFEDSWHLLPKKCLNHGRDSLHVVNTKLK